MHSEASTKLVKDLLDVIVGSSSHLVTFSRGDARSEEIWTYERVPGRRLVCPWRAHELPVGVLQIDLVFGEELPEPPVMTEIPGLDGAPIFARTVTAELSLAWKLEWLANDAYPQVKDLYDAALLAEHTALRRDLFERALAIHRVSTSLLERLLGDMTFDAGEVVRLRAEHPNVEGDVEQWTSRVRDLLRATLEG